MNFKVDVGEEGQKAELPALKLIHALGYAYKTNFEINMERTDYRQSLLYGRLNEALKRLNDLDDEGIEGAIRQIHEDAFPANLDIVEANERVRLKLVGLSREGGLDQPVTVKQYGKNGLEYVRVKFFNFEEPEKNDFLVTNQFELQGYKTKIESDIVVFVNGIPLVEIECKKPSSRDYLKEAWDDNLEKYQRIGMGFRKLFYYNHVIIATADVASKYGTIGALPNAYAKWTSLYNMKLEELEKLVGRIPTPQDILLAGLLQKNSLLDMLKNFVIYEVENNKRVKKVAKHQQYRVVTECISRIQTGKTTQDKGGVVWHTQGSGKSLSMVWFATQLLFKMKNPPILLITDRRQLDRQIHSTFQACGFPFPIKAKSREHLADELQNPQGKTIMTTIQKFGARESSVLSDKRIFALIDEAQRTQYGWTAEHMRDSLPNAVFFAFSGTPIDKKNKSTFKVFGPLIDKYSFEESKKDGATLPVLHTGRMSNLFVEDGESIDIIFERIFKDLPKEKKAELKRRYASKDDIAEAPHRIKKIVEDLITHFNTTISINRYKGMIVCSSRDAAVIYKRELDKQGGPVSKIIMTSESDEIGKDGTSWREYYLSQEERERQSEQFKDPDEPTKLLIVVDMLLVGYDVPVVQVMYLDKNLKEHTLLQAMARVNRLYDAAKTYGLIVDYIGVSKNLKKALEIFEKEDIQGAFDTLDQELIELEARHQVMKDLIDDLKGKDNSDIILKFQTEDSQVELESAFKGFAKALDPVLPGKEASKYKKDFDFACYVRGVVRSRYHGDKPDNSEYSRKIQQLIDDYVKSSGITEIMNPREITYENFLANAGKLKKDSAKAALVRSKAMQVIRELEHTNPGYYGKLREKLEKIIIEEKERVLDDAAYFDLYGQIYTQAIEGKEITERDSGIKDEYERVLFYLFSGNIDNEKLVRSIASIISNIVKKETKKIDWQDKDEITNKIFITAYDNLSEKLSEGKKKELSDEVLRLAGVHFGK